MAPGCYSPTSSAVKSNESTRPSMKPSIEQLESFVQEVIEIEVIKEEATITTQNSNQIPLPSTPPPPESLYKGHDATGDKEESSDEDESDSEEEDSSSSSSSSDDEHEEDEEEEEDEKLEDDDEEDEDEDEEEEIKKEADTFEILEQTIIKQKRLAKLKNTDLRRKVLLKRTFDLVLEIMDAENGFDDDDDTTMKQQPQQHQKQTSLSVSSCSMSNNNSSIHQRSLNLDDEQTSSIHNNNNNELELHLHPDPSCRMDDSDEEEHEETVSSSMLSSSSIDESEEEIRTTLLKLVDMETSPLQTTSSNENHNLSSSLVARVPRQLKRRSSGSDDEHDGDNEEEEEDENEVETDQSDLLNRFDDETYFYEYSMGLLDDQQLNYSTDRPRKLDADLNIYNDSPVVESEQLVVEKSSKDRNTSNGSSQPTRRRSDHPRKKLKTNV